MFICFLGLPILPIFVSFGISVWKLYEAQKRSARMNKEKSGAHKHASVTVCIITCVYIVCNIPMFLNCLYFGIVVLGKVDRNERMSHSSTELSIFFIQYFWGLCYILLVAVYSTINPVVYFTRMKPFRNFLLRLRGVDKISETFDLSSRDTNKRTLPDVCV